jgi:hypothetical protein
MNHFSIMAVGHQVAFIDGTLGSPNSLLTSNQI